MNWRSVPLWTFGRVSSGWRVVACVAIVASCSAAPQSPVRNDALQSRQAVMIGLALEGAMISNATDGPNLELIPRAEVVSIRRGLDYARLVIAPAGVSDPRKTERPIYELNVGPVGFSIVEDGGTFMRAQATVQGSIVVFRAAGFTEAEFVRYLKSMRVVSYEDWTDWIRGLPTVN
jgi:hypothetical protein